MARTAKLFRMASDEHLCPFGLKSKDLLEREGFDVGDHKLTSRDETETFMKRHSVETTPQTFIESHFCGTPEFVCRKSGARRRSHR